MAAVGGIFHQRADAQQAVDALVLAGVEPDSIRFEVLQRSLIDALGPLDIPAEAVREYERSVVPGDVLVLVDTGALPAATISNQLGTSGGLVIELGHFPIGHPGVE